MTDIQRITEILKNYTKKHNIMASVVILEAYAEELVNNGVIMPPCKVGQTVWYVHESTNEVCEAMVVSIEYNSFTLPQEWIEIKYYSALVGSHKYKSRIDLMLGKTVFLTKEEAEAKLKERDWK